VGMHVADRAILVGEFTSAHASWTRFVLTRISLLSLMSYITDWRRPPYPVHTADYATYVQIITWFLDTPSPEAPFSVHRMALAGKELGKEVGQWFGPSTAAGAIKYVHIVSSFLISNADLPAGLLFMLSPKPVLESLSLRMVSYSNPMSTLHRMIVSSLREDTVGVHGEGVRFSFSLVSV
jgi:Peptidase family C54